MIKQINIALYSRNTPKSTVLNSNGEYILDDICLDMFSTEELDTGNYDAEALFLLDKSGKYKNIVEESIVKIRVQYGYEVFRVCRVFKENYKLRAYLRQITIDDSLRCCLRDVRPTELNGQALLEYTLKNTNEYKSNKQYAKDLEVFSDIQKLTTSYYQDISLYQALHDSDQSFKNRFGGEVQRRGYRININNKIGTNRGFQIRSSKNLLGFEADTNIDNICTRIKPKGFNGITIDAYVDSPLINNYSRIYTKVIKYEDIKVKDENISDGYDSLEKAQEELIRRAKLEFTENHLDEIKAEYKISFVDLSETEEYKNYSVLERCYIGDTVNVFEENLGVNINVRVKKIKYNILTQRVMEIELSNSDINKNTVPSIMDIVKAIEDIPSIDSVLVESKKNATDLINSGLKDSYVIVRKNEILIMDTQDINTATNVWRWNNGGLGFSSTGYYGEFGTAMTRDGKIVADFITTGLLNANLIKTGILGSFNGNSWLNMENGNFDFAKGNLSFDGKNLQMIGKLINILNGFGIEMNQGGLIFANEGEIVGGIRSSRFLSNTAINGFNLVSTRDGDYIDISFTDGENFEGSPDFVPIIRITKSKHEMMGNFKGIQLLDDVRVSSDKDLFVENVYRGATAEGTKFGRYYNNTWCGSIEATAKRVSNLNIYYDSGWYAYSIGTNGAPSSYGVVLHLKWGETDFIQIAFDFSNAMYQRAWVNGAWTNWTQR